MKERSLTVTTFSVNPLGNKQIQLIMPLLLSVRF